MEDALLRSIFERARWINESELIQRRMDTFTKQGYVLDKDRMIDGQIFDEDHFDHLISETQEIRAGERRSFRRSQTFTLQRSITMYLDYVTRQARRHILMTRADRASKLDAFLQFNNAKILQDKGKVTAAIAKAFVESEFEQYRVIQDRLDQSGFDKRIAAEQEDEEASIHQCPYFSEVL